MTVERITGTAVASRSQPAEGRDRDRPRLRLRELCQEFESLFLYRLLKEMRKAVPRSSLVHGGLAEDIFLDLRDQELARSSSRAGNLGLGELLYEQLSRYLDEPGRKGPTPGETQY